MLPEAGGIYLVIAALASPARLKVRSGRSFELTSGVYGYVGSARRGLAPRLNRHLSTEKKPHWHIDFLLARATIKSLVCAVTKADMECALARGLAARLPAVSGFGASDCNCDSHLFQATDTTTLTELAQHVYREIGLTPAVYTPPDFNSWPETKAGPTVGPML